MSNGKIFLFIGPTSYGIQLEDIVTHNTVIRPPVRRGDIQELIDCSPPAIIAIVDGTYHSYPAVSHVEIKNALKKRWSVWGMSSMGAIRAAEMHTLGMKGYGKVFQRFVDDEDLPDDYVALIHSDESPYSPLSEPLIHIESLLNEMVTDEIIPIDIKEMLIHEMNNMWFGFRTLQYLKGRNRELLIDKNDLFCKN